jgi:hypothetical protein
MQQPRDGNAKRKGHPALPRKAKLQSNAADSRMVNVYKRLKTDGASHRLRVGSWELGGGTKSRIGGEHRCNIHEMETSKKKGHPAPPHNAKLKSNAADSRTVNVYKRL